MKFFKRCYAKIKIRFIKSLNVDKKSDDYIRGASDCYDLLANFLINTCVSYIIISFITSKK